MEGGHNTTIFKKLKEYKQDHLLDYYNLITDNESKEKFLSQLEKTDFSLLQTLHKAYLDKNINKSENITQDRNFSPIQNHSKCDFTENQQNEINEIGLKAVEQGQIALLILAGGQGSRLGFEKAKGMYNIQMPSNKSLFEYLCNRFLSIQKNLTKKSTLLIMTSIENHDETVEFFKLNNYFEIDPNNVIIFPQDTIAALDLEGKIICKKVDEIFEAPNGNGGCFIAMKKHKIIEKLLERNVEFLQVISIDNPISKPLDPFFAGLTIYYKKQMAAKVIPKREASEPVGIFVNVNNKPEMMDYVDTPKEILEQVNEKGQLVYRHGNILNYLISVNVLNNVLLNDAMYSQLINEFHISKKKIPCLLLNEEKNTISSNIDGIKFELFFNSIFSFTEVDGFVLFEVDRNEEFSPVKNSEDSKNDNPRTARQMMTKIFANWYQKNGGEIKNEKNLDYLLEISYLLSYDGENIYPGKNVPQNIEVMEENNKFYFS